MAFLRSYFKTCFTFRLHLSSWRFIGHSIRSRGKNHWGIRQKPKCDLFKELKLSNGRESANDGELGEERLVDGWEEQITDDRTSHTEFCSSLPHASKLNRGKGKQLLQFSKSYRPAFYGIWSTKRQVVFLLYIFKNLVVIDQPLRMNLSVCLGFHNWTSHLKFYLSLGCYNYFQSCCWTTPSV